MGKEKPKVYLFTRVSTSMQIDGYSLEAQKMWNNQKKAHRLHYHRQEK